MTVAGMPMRPFQGLTVSLVVVTWLAAVSPALGQTTATSREDAISQQQAEKAAALTPKEPNKAERLVKRLEPLATNTQPTGFYPWFGSVLGGGWMALGAGYRATYADTGRFNAIVGWSLKNYRMLDSSLQLPTFLDDRARVTVYGKYLFADKVSFYGLGNDSDQDDKTSFKYQPTTFGADADVELVPYLFVGGGYGYEAVDSGSGNSNSGLSIEEGFTPDEAPGLNQDVKYTVTKGYAAIDWRESPGYNTKGGLYRIEYRRYSERDDKPYDFEWTEAEVRQYVPLLRANWVLAFRGVVTISNGQHGGQVPYFMMPTLGSSKDLRGFSNRRFRDLNRILLQGEYRWRPSRFVDMALFYDTGKVTARRGDLDLDGLKSAYGAGIRFHGPTFTALRFDVAKSKEGLSFIISTGVF